MIFSIIGTAFNILYALAYTSLALWIIAFIIHIRRNRKDRRKDNYEGKRTDRNEH